MSALSGTRTVHPRGYILGQVGADRLDKGVIVVIMAHEYPPRVPPRTKSSVPNARIEARRLCDVASNRVVGCNCLVILCDILLELDVETLR